MDVWGAIKNHKMLFGGVVVVLLVLVVIIRAANSNNAGAIETSAAPTGSVDTGTALQVAQMQASTQAAGISAQLQDDQAKYAAATSLADLQGKYSEDIAGITAGTQNLAISTSGTSQDLATTLGAQVQGKQIESQTEIAMGNFNNEQQLATINAGITNNVISLLTSQNANAAQAKQDAIAKAQAAVDNDRAIINANTPAWRADFFSHGSEQPNVPYTSDMNRLNALQA